RPTPGGRRGDLTTAAKSQAPHRQRNIACSAHTTRRSRYLSLINQHSWGRDGNTASITAALALTRNQTRAVGSIVPARDRDRLCWVDLHSPRRTSSEGISADPGSICKGQAADVNFDTTGFALSERGCINTAGGAGDCQRLLRYNLNRSTIS